jgi:hypothetical protein
MRWHWRHTEPCPDCGAAPGTDHAVEWRDQVGCRACQESAANAERSRHERSAGQWITCVRHNPDAVAWCDTCGSFVTFASHEVDLPDDHEGQVCLAHASDAAAMSDNGRAAPALA